MLIFKRNKGEAVRVGAAELVVLETHRTWVKLGVRAPRSLVVERAELARATPAAEDLRPCDMCRSSERPRHLWNGRVFCDDVAACGLAEAKLEPKR